MYIFFILFFTSLLSIVFLIGRKLLIIKEGGIIIQEERFAFEFPYLDEAKEKAAHNVKKYGYVTIVITLRLYFRTANLLRHAYGEMRDKVRAKLKKEDTKNGEKKEISKFLKSVGEYKHKLREIKHRIRKEESF